MPGEPESESPGDESGNHSYEGELSGSFRGGRFAGRIPKEWIIAAAPAMRVVAYGIGLAIAFLIICFGVSLLIR